MMQQDYLEEYVRLVHQGGEVGPDYVILTVRTDEDAEYWQSRAGSWPRSIMKPDARLIVVVERWNGKAGNGLGTLNAVIEANRTLGINLLAELEQGRSVFLYHNAGEGQRLKALGEAATKHGKGAAPLPGSIGEIGKITLLETVMALTRPLAEHFGGRLTSFWNDHLFVPSQPILPPSLPIALFCQRQQSVNIADYGLLVEEESNRWVLFEKPKRLSLPFARYPLAQNLGSFSLSNQMLALLLKTFQPELSSKRGKFDTDFHFWMPLSIERHLYLQLDPEGAAHYDRLAAMRQELGADRRDLIAPMDIGTCGYSKDFGTFEKYTEAVRVLDQPGSERHFLSMLLGVTQDLVGHTHW